jgi:hypothetical protein
MADQLPKTFQMRFDLSNEQDVRIARFLQDYPWSKTQKVKEILLMYIEGQPVRERQNQSDAEKMGEPPDRQILDRVTEERP